MKSLLKDYEYYLKIERAMSQNTVASYCSDVEKFLSFLDLPAEKADTVSEQFRKPFQAVPGQKDKFIEIVLRMAYD